MSQYHIRPAGLEDIDIIVRHRVRMFQDMGTPVDVGRLEAALRPWLRRHLASGDYRGWLAAADREIVSGGGITVVHWPPGPRDFGGRVALVYNMYTEPHHRRRGLARRILESMHAWCAETGVRLIGLAASPDGQPLYQALGYEPAPQPFLFKLL